MMETSFPRPGRVAAAAVAAALAALIAAGQSSPAPRVLRGPYLQAAEPGSVSVAWYTDLATEGLLQWRAEGGAWRDARDPAGPALRHEVTLAAPAPGQAYEYRLFDGAGRLLEEPFDVGEPGLEVVVRRHLRLQVVDERLLLLHARAQVVDLVHGPSQVPLPARVPPGARSLGGPEPPSTVARRPTSDVDRDRSGPRARGSAGRRRAEGGGQVGGADHADVALGQTNPHPAEP